MHALTEIVFVNTLGGSTPAKVNRVTGVMMIDAGWWKKLPTEHRLFILLHEYAHAILNTTDEYEADAYAFKLYTDLGYSLTESVKALTRVLSYNGYSKNEHIGRTLAQINRAKKYDKATSKFQGAWKDKFYKLKN